MCLEKLHPLVSFIYFLLILIILAGSFNPATAGIGLISVIAAMLTRRNYKNIKMLLLISIPTSIFLILIQPLFSHNGITALFYINDMAVTLETIIFGAVALVLLVGAVGWFLLMADIFTQEKLMYLFGRITPRFALLFSMTLRLIPQLKRRYDQIAQARTFLNVNDNNMREKAVRIGTLTEWSLESSMETAQSMEARGYGARRRTSFHMFKFRREDGIVLAVLCILGLFEIASLIRKIAYVSFFPQINIDTVVNPQLEQILFYTIYGIICILGIIPPKKKKGARKL